MKKDEALRSQLDVSVTSNGLVVAQPKSDSKLDPEPPRIPDVTDKPEIKAEKNIKYNQARKKTFPADKFIHFSE